ncbi:MAG: phosphonate metabolism transcriptional regulator PhnF [Pseudotabrizicola sp.]|uniref:phosphonate metabolism transcriptional regulator PhnF n=1 Tax=Pseudotabrizicola sp. TaxID=2939647 RepID=UPI0027215F0A|nr:phosphonate metabolism transcriptional regulator PhnF [Pseudotabrizicola sp.]MDO9639231.1 phosphonate metabolism transcriptional regulator PhnF [Pseudotabrizicola sp.]
MTDPTRTALWTSIAETLSAEIAKGHYRPGDKLPTEAQLSVRFGVNRHTVRHAVQSLVQAGTLHSRRGSGVFVMLQPTDYPLGLRVRFHQNIAASGRTASRQFNRLETRGCDAGEAEALGLTAGAPVHVVEGVSMADGQPVAVFRSVFPAGRFPDLLTHAAKTPSITAALSACGVADYTRRSTRITARLANAVQAVALRLAEGAAILRSEAVNVDPAGQPVEYGLAWFAGDRVTLTHAPDQP